MGYLSVQAFGGLILWASKLFKGSYRNCIDHPNSFLVGCLVVLIIAVIIISV